MNRKDVKLGDTWKLEDIYENESILQEEIQQLKQLLDAFKNYKDTLSKGSHQILQMLKDYEQLFYLLDRIYVYTNQRYYEDTTNSKYQKLSGESQILSSKFSEITAFMEPEILSLDASILEDEVLKDYTRYLYQITRNKDHVLDVNTESLLARTSEVTGQFDTIFSMFNNADMRFDEVADKDGNTHPLTYGTYANYMESKDRSLRQNAFNNLYKDFKKYNNTLSAIYYGNLKQGDFFAKEHAFHGCFENQLFNNEIPTTVYTNLIDSIHNNLDSMYQYVKLRKQVLGLDELHMYDVYVPLASVPDKKYTFEEAKDIVEEGLSILGEDYISILKEGYENRWIDIYENVGKRSGAFSWGCYGCHPYVFLNYNGSLNDIFTLAHEMGHAIHSYYSNKSQSILDAGYRIFVAEVASTCNESLLIHHLMNKTTDKEEKKYLINYFLDQFKGTMYRQTMFAEFEYITHNLVKEGNVLTASECNEIYYNLNKKYFGEDMISDENIQYEWSRIPHFYTPFYVYQYATGFAAAIAISTKILNKEEGIIEKYKQFLSGGCSMSPIDLLKICGVDMTSTDPVNQALAVFKEYVQKLETLV